MKYTERVENYQICDPTFIDDIYSDDFEVKTDRPLQFDVVKWYKLDKPREMLCFDHATKTFKPQMVEECCYVVATLQWDEFNDDFELHSIGMRFVEEKPSADVMQMILDFCDKKFKELTEEE